MRMKRLTYFFFVILPFFFFGCMGKVVYKDVYIPTRCDIPERVKPKKEAFDDFTEFQTHLRAYYKGIEMDLLFCRTGKSEKERIKAPP